MLQFSVLFPKGFMTSESVRFDMFVKRFCFPCILFCIMAISISANTFAENGPVDSDDGQSVVTNSPEQFQVRMTALSRQMSQYGFQEDEIIAARDMMDTNSGGIMIVEPVMEKIYEGMAKGVDNQRIMQAIEQVRNRYREAYRQAGIAGTETGQTLQLGELIAESFAAGLLSEDCERILNQLRERVRTMDRQSAYELLDATMLAARSLARSRVDSETIAGLLSGALQEQYEARQMVMLQQQFQRRTRYNSAESVARNFAEDIGQGVSVDQLGRERSRAGETGNGAASGRTAGKSGDEGADGAGGNSENSSESGSGSGGTGSGGGSGGSGNNGNGGSSGAGSDNSSAGAGNSSQAGGSSTNAEGSGHGHGGEAGKRK